MLNEQYKNYFKQRLVENIINKHELMEDSWWRDLLSPSRGGRPSRRPDRTPIGPGGTIDIEGPLTVESLTGEQLRYIRRYYPNINPNTRVQYVRGGFIIDTGKQQRFFWSKPDGTPDISRPPYKLPRGIYAVGGSIILVGYDADGYPIFQGQNGENVYTNPATPSEVPDEDFAPSLPGGQSPTSPTITSPEY